VNTFFSARLRELRGEQTQLEIAKNLGISQQKWQRLETGYNEPSMEMLQKICLLFGVSADWLLNISTLKLKESSVTNGVKTKISELKGYAVSVSKQADELLNTIANLERSL